jgi:hypothetical protein
MLERLKVNIAPTAEGFIEFGEQNLRQLGVTTGKQLLRPGRARHNRRSKEVC